MRLSELTSEAGVSFDADAGITGLTADSREVRAGYLFAALPGARADGRDFIPQAIEKGASAVLALPDTKVEGCVFVAAENPRRAFAKIAAAFCGGRQPETVVAVTGTNGKTSTVNFCRQIWQAMDHAAASLGTLGVIAPGFSRAGIHTTPDPVTLHAELAELEAAGVTHLAMEASSQGLDQYRLDGVRISATGFTNLTLDHLDYHGTMEKYFDAKARLFSEVAAAGGVCVLNADDAASAKLAEIARARNLRVLTFGRAGRDIVLKQQKALPTGQFIEIDIMGETYPLELPLAGEFQAMNALCALGLVIAADPDNRMLHIQAVQALERLQGVRGRMELVATHRNGAAVYVDYAHTPDGLETLLKSLRPHCAGKLHVVFGCGGDRDKTKRPIMGGIAAGLADRVIVTDDNPRTEKAEEIRKQIMENCKGAVEIGDRRKAIAAAVAELAPGDILVIAGKGHEQGQVVGAKVLPFDDAAEARAAVEENAA